MLLCRLREDQALSARIGAASRVSTATSATASVIDFCPVFKHTFTVSLKSTKGYRGMDWLSLTVAALLGIVVGSVCAALPYRRRNEAFYRRIRNLHLEAQHLEQEFIRARDQANALQASLRTAQAAKGELEIDLGQLARERDLLMAAVLARTVRLEQALTICQLGSPSAELRDAQARLTALTQAHAALEAQLVELRRQLAEARDAAGQAPHAVNVRQHVQARKDALIRAAIEAGQAVRYVECPQALSAAKGIGSTFEKRLYEAGLGTFWELANLSDEDFRVILALDGGLPMRSNFQTIRDDARRLAVETDSVGCFWQGPPPDDFAPLEGIGDAFKRRLYAAGICTFEALANATVEQLTAICPPSRLRTPNYADWIAQARILAQQKASQRGG